jgi:hypothetical protein
MPNCLDCILTPRTYFTILNLIWRTRAFPWSHCTENMGRLCLACIEHALATKSTKCTSLLSFLTLTFSYEDIHYCMWRLRIACFGIWSWT